jgi:hypothetical protein
MSRWRCSPLTRQGAAGDPSGCVVAHRDQRPGRGMARRRRVPGTCVKGGQAAQRPRLAGETPNSVSDGGHDTPFVEMFHRKGEAPLSVWWHEGAGFRGEAHAWGSVPLSGVGRVRGIERRLGFVHRVSTACAPLVHRLEELSTRCGGRPRWWPVGSLLLSIWLRACDRSHCW